LIRITLSFTLPMLLTGGAVWGGNESADQWSHRDNWHPSPATHRKETESVNMTGTSPVKRGVRLSGG